MKPFFRKLTMGLVGTTALATWGCKSAPNDLEVYSVTYVDHARPLAEKRYQQVEIEMQKIGVKLAPYYVNYVKADAETAKAHDVNYALGGSAGIDWERALDSRGNPIDTIRTVEGRMTRGSSAESSKTYGIDFAPGETAVVVAYLADTFTKPAQRPLAQNELKHFTRKIVPDTTISKNDVTVYGDAMVPYAKGDVGVSGEEKTSGQLTLTVHFKDKKISRYVLSQPYVQYQYQKTTMGRDGYLNSDFLDNVFDPKDLKGLKSLREKGAWYLDGRNFYNNGPHSGDNDFYINWLNANTKKATDNRLLIGILATTGKTLANGATPADLALKINQLKTKQPQRDKAHLLPPG